MVSLPMFAAPHPELKKESGVDTLEIGSFDPRYLRRMLRAALAAAFEGLRKFKISEGLQEENATASSRGSASMSSPSRQPWYSASNLSKSFVTWRNRID